MLQASGGNVVTFSSYELLAKRCFELLPADYETNGVVAETAGAEGFDREIDPAKIDAAAEEKDEEERKKREVFLRVDGDGATNVCGVAEHPASDKETLLRLLRASVSRRETAATGTNATSSRSHAVYLLNLPGGGRLALIDLAGNEGSQETMYHTAQHISEAKEINNSLSVLRACLIARSTDVGHVPFRESVLTRVLKDALTDTKAATVLLACLSPACTHLEHSLRTLRTAVHLTGAEGKVVEEEEEISMPSVRTNGPNKWDHTELCKWVEEQPFAAKVKLPPTMTGKKIMKITEKRLAPLCGGDTTNTEKHDATSEEAAVAAELFAALRLASKEADENAREQRRMMFANKQTEMVSKTGYTGAVGFSKDAPVKPQIAGND